MSQHWDEDTLPEDPELAALYYLKAVVTADILRGESNAGYIYREPPVRANDSGWRVLSLASSDDDLDDPESLAAADIGWLLTADASLAPLLSHPTGAEFHRDGSGGRWEAYEGDDNNAER